MSEPLPELDAELYAQLRSLASRVSAHRTTLQPTALLHEAWMKLERAQGRFESRRHFLAVAAKAMRQILVNRARDRAAQKRGRDPRRTTLTGLGERDETVELLDLDRAIGKLEEVDPVAARVVVLRVFGGLTLAEVSDVMDVSERTASRAWRFAKAFLKSALEAD